MAIAVIGVLSLAPAAAGAQTISVSQTITITATVAPKRSIVVNDKGQMTKIYSNTDQNVEPGVYLNDVPGESRPLTPELKKQYDDIMAKQKKVIGVSIPVEPPRATGESARNVLLSSLSSMLKPLNL
jgi:hypothetical protein